MSFGNFDAFMDFILRIVPLPLQFKKYFSDWCPFEPFLANVPIYLNTLKYGTGLDLLVSSHQRKRQSSLWLTRTVNG